MWCLENCHLDVLWYIRSISCLNGIWYRYQEDLIHDSVATSHWADFRLNVMWIVAGNSVLDFSFKRYAESRARVILKDFPLQTSGCDPDCEGLTAGFSCLPEGAEFWKPLELRICQIWWTFLETYFQALRVEQASTATPRVGFIVWIRRLLRSEVYQICFTLHYTTLYYTTLHYITLHCITT